MTRSRWAHRTTWPALALLAGLACPVTGTPSAQAADGTCVGRGEYRAITRGMTVQQVAGVLHGQLPFAEVEGHGKQRYRWYAACDAWQSEADVYVRYRQPVVGRRTVTKKGLDVFVPDA